MKRKKKIKIPRQYSLVKLNDESLKENTSLWGSIIFLGEIPNMRGHCVIADSCGNIKVGYHIENFVELDEDTEV
jgi:hypothetical protein